MAGILAAVATGGPGGEIGGEEDDGSNLMQVQGRLSDVQDNQVHEGDRNHVWVITVHTGFHRILQSPIRIMQS